MTMRGLLVTAAIAAVPFPATAQEMTPEMMQAAMAAAMPGPEHDRLAILAGEWDMDITFAVAPGQTQRVTGVAHNRMILGGRFLVSDARANEPLMGQIIESSTIYGYDRRAKEYTLIGLDTFGTYYVTAAGSGTGQRVVMPGRVVDPTSGREERYDMLLEWVDADEYVTEIRFKTADGEFTAVRSVHRRRGS